MAFIVPSILVAMCPLLIVKLVLLKGDLLRVFVDRNELHFDILPSIAFWMKNHRTVPNMLVGADPLESDRGVGERRE